MNHPKLGRYDTISTRSHEDLDHPKLYKQGASPPQGLLLYISTSFSVIALGYVESLSTEDTSSYFDH
ncbi:hypothetical protein PIB30_048222 [Stylosanthes scabra]|uniref:Uncharacterized protein n=1 Tax=Stylosanthes scabra TaxID=79078 RepID=A0ABU6UFM1_9FABA|nr:hypothetical protein [Stylosanthes scabra]